MIEIDIHRDPISSDREMFYQALWKSYFKNIAIGERKNPRLQRQFIPRRYWKNLVEMS
jgi:probable DNA metabolism protein